MDFRWRGGAEVFLLFANIYFKRIVLEKLWKYFCKDLLELGTGVVGINLRPLDYLCCHRDFSHSILLDQNCVFSLLRFYHITKHYFSCPISCRLSR